MLYLLGAFREKSKKACDEDEGRTVHMVNYIFNIDSIDLRFSKRAPTKCVCVCEMRMEKELFDLHQVYWNTQHLWFL